MQRLTFFLVVALSFLVAAIRLPAANDRSSATSSPERRMSDADALKKFGVKLEAIPERPNPTFSPIPPYPQKMYIAKQPGWSEYIISVTAGGRVAQAELVGYSDKEFANAESTLTKWKFRKGTAAGLYHVKLRYVFADDGHADVLGGWSAD
jgi:hypothetical protein